MQEEQRKLILEILDKAVDITVATNRPDGWPQATTVSFVNDGLNLYFGTWAKSQKAANIARDNRVSVTANAPYSAWSTIKSVSMAARAEFVTNAAELGRVGELMTKRFGPELAKLTSIDMSETRIVRLKPEIISILDYSKGFGHTAQLAIEPKARTPA